MPINPERLRQLRKTKRMSRQNLAQRSKISLRTIYRLENAASSPGAVRDRTINQLAEALSVEPAVLTGDLPMPEDKSSDRPLEGERVQVSAFLEPEVRLAYDLIKRRYGVNATTVFNLGPLLFTLLAEGSFVWRRRKLEELRESAARLDEMGNIAGHLRFAFAAHRAIEGAAGEEESIGKCDLFGKEVSQESFELGYDRSTNNPFADYLRHFARKIGDPYVVMLDPWYGELQDDGPLKGYPDYQVCQRELEEISGGSTSAMAVLQTGQVRLKDIPDDLWVEGAAEARADWLEEKFPNAKPRDLEELKDLIDSRSSGGGDSEQ